MGGGGGGGGGAGGWGVLEEVIPILGEDVSTFVRGSPNKVL